MGKITEPLPVKLFVGMLSSDTSLFERVRDDLIQHLGPVDLESPVWTWEHTKYYEDEMGEGLKRKFVFFDKLIDPGSIADIKLKTNEHEGLYRNERGGRRINLDPGYLDASKLVLVSTKNYSHRIYLGRGIYGEVTLIYAKKNYQILPYTYPDFRSEEYLEVFRKARDLYMRS